MPRPRSRTRKASNRTPLAVPALLLALAPAGIRPAHATHSATTFQSAAQPPAAATMADVLAASSAADWRPLDPAHLLVVTLEAGRVLIELAPDFDLVKRSVFTGT